MIGNMNTLNLKEYCLEKGIDTGFDEVAFQAAFLKSQQVFHNYLS
jgi:hypothetical protein